MENYDEFFKKARNLEYDWLIRQMQRPDRDERFMAYYESIRYAIITDNEDWCDLGHEIFIALATNDIAALLVALCGWGPKNLAKHVRLLRNGPHDTIREIPGTLMIDWSDDLRTSCPCAIQSHTHMIVGLDYSVFTRENAPTATIQNIFVRFAPLNEENEYDFQCVSQAERDEANDEEIFWYPPEEANE